jgi:DNA integrity scanning protein DisA with diadenylate cyclase activity
MDNTHQIERIAEIMIRNEKLFPIVRDIKSSRGKEWLKFALIRTTGLEFVVNTYFNSLDTIWFTLDTKVMSSVLNSTYRSILFQFMIEPNQKEIKRFLKKEKLI